jgi:hypothetical protein
MTSILTPIAARVLSSPGRPFSGKGYVERAEADGRSVIALAAGKMTVQSAPGALTGGDIVFVKVQGKDLVIEKAPPATTPLAASDALDIEQAESSGPADSSPRGGARLSGSPGAGAVSGGFSFPLSGPRSPREGFYYFDTAEKAISWLATVCPGVKGDDARLNPEALARAPVVIQVITAGSEGARAVVLPLQAADARLSYFVRDSLSSSLWTDFFPEGLLPFLQKNRVIAAQRLIAVDALLPPAGSEAFPDIKNGLSAVGGGAAGKNGLSELCDQWLTMAMDESVPISILAKQSPFPSAAGLPPLLEYLRAGGRMQPDDFATIPRIGDFSIIPSAFDDPAQRAEMLPKLCEGLGIYHEHACATVEESGQAPVGMPRSLKYSLMALERDIDLAIVQKNAGHPQDPRAVYALGRAISETWASAAAELLRELLSWLPGQSSPASGGGAWDLGDTERMFIQFQEWSKKISSLFESTAEAISSQAIKIHGAAEALRSTNNTAGDQMTAAVRAAMEIDNLTESIVQRIKEAFHAVTGKIETALETLKDQLAGLSARRLPFASREETAAAPPAGRETENPSAPPMLRAQAFAALREAALDAARQIGAISAQLDKTDERALNQIERLPRDPSSGEEKLPIEATRRLIETALQRIDTLQLSARPATLGDFRQQTVIVPMNIDGQWNDVIVKFVRDGRQSGGKKAPKNIAVTINVAPALLGEITVSMKYASASDLTVRMDFDSDRALSWFAANRQGLVEALINLGFDKPVLSMQKIAGRGRPAETRSKPTPATAVDIVA